MKNRKVFVIKATTMSVLLMAAAVTWTHPSASARSPRPTAVELIGIGAVTISQGQAMRVNLVNSAESSTVRLSVKFIDKAGQVLKSEELSLGPGSTSGAAVFEPTDVSASTLIPAVQTPVHVIVESVPDAPEAPSPFVMPSLEIFDRKAGKVASIHASFQRLSSTSFTGGQ